MLGGEASDLVEEQETFADGSEYDGYFFLDKRSGHGVLKYGKVGCVEAAETGGPTCRHELLKRLDREEEELRQEAEEAVKNARISDKVALSDFEHRYEGQWLAGYHRMMGSHCFARSGNYYYTMDADRGKAYYPFDVAATAARAQTCQGCSLATKTRRSGSEPSGRRSSARKKKFLDSSGGTRGMRSVGPLRAVHGCRD